MSRLDDINRLTCPSSRPAFRLAWTGWSGALRSRRFWPLLLGFFLSLPAAAVVDPPPGFTEGIEVRVVDIEAVVTRGGERVEGLRPSDLRLLIDGEEVPIEYFSEVRDGVAISSSGALASGGAAPVLEPGSTVTTRYLIFVDDDFSIPSRRNAVLRRLAEDLEHLGSQDRVAVVAWDGRRVELLASWLPSGAALRRVLEKAQDRPSYGLQRRSEWSRLQSELRYSSRQVSGGSSFSTIGFSGASRTESARVTVGSELGARVGRLSWALTSALRGFAQPEGRKVVLFLSGALPPVDSETGFGSSNRLDRLDRFARGGEARRFFAPPVDTANRLGYTIYPVDLGENGPALVDSESHSLGDSLWRRRQAADDEVLSEDSLHYLAEATGGRALLDGARFSALEQVAKDTRSYYWLGFTPAWRQDDRAHDIRLVMRTGRADVRSRTGFSDLSREARLTMAVESAHLFDLPLPFERSFEIEVGETASVSRSRIRVPLTLLIPAADFTFLPAGAPDAVARVELRIAASDDRGEAAEIPVVTIDIRRDQLTGEIFRWQTTLELRRRPHRLLLAIQDPLGDLLLARRLDINPSTE